MMNPTDMHGIPSSISPRENSFQRTPFLLLLIFAGAVAAYVSWSILKYSILSFDGAFNTQAALNFFRGNGLALDYGGNWLLQTGLPFQL